MLLLIAGLFVLFLLSGMPVAFALALASFPVFVLPGTMPPTSDEWMKVQLKQISSPL